MTRRAIEEGDGEGREEMDHYRKRAHDAEADRDRWRTRAEDLEDELRAAADSLGMLAVASRQNGFEDLIDVRGFAHSRWRAACELLPETKCRCSRCGCLPTHHRVDDEELRECMDCECTEYEV